jgi:hypothetical protein
VTSRLAIADVAVRWFDGLRKTPTTPSPSSTA